MQMTLSSLSSSRHMVLALFATLSILILLLPSHTHAISNPSSSTPLQRITTFLSWLRDQKALVKGVEITSDGVKGGLGLRTTESLNDREVFASIPLSSLINIEHVFLDEWSQEFLDPLSDTDAMAVYMARMRLRGDSQWDGYIQLLPAEFPTSPLFWSPDQLELVQRSTVRDFTAKRLARARETYDSLAPSVHQEISFDSFLWGLSILWSRTHSVGVKDGEGKWHKAPCFVPLADLMNTAATGKEGNNVDCQTNPASTHFECYATRSIGKGEELLVPYGSRQGGGMSNGQLLLDYGFAQEQNMHDVVALTFPPLRLPGSYDLHEPEKLAVDETLYTLLSSLLQSLSKPDPRASNHTFLLAWPSGSVMSLPPERASEVLPGEVLKFARIWTTQIEDLTAAGGSDAAKSKLESGSPLSPNHARRTLQFVHSQLLNGFASYGTSLSEDQSELNQLLQSLEDREEDDSLTDQQHQDEYDAYQVRRSSILVRMGEKKLLSIYAARLAEAIATPQTPNTDETKAHDEL